MRGLLSAVAAFALGLASSPGVAQETDSSSGNWLYAKCTSRSSNLLDFGECLGMIQGVLDGVTADHMIAGRPVPFCIRANVTKGQLRDVVIKFMEDDPSIRDQSAAAIVLFAVIGAFPCPKPQ